MQLQQRAVLISSDKEDHFACVVYDLEVHVVPPIARRSRPDVMFHSYYYFSSSVSFFQVPDSLRDLTQRVAPVDDWCYFSCLHEIAQDGQVLFVRVRQKKSHVLAHEP